jgi:hypothetical protein
MGLTHWRVKMSRLSGLFRVGDYWLQIQSHDLILIWTYSRNVSLALDFLTQGIYSRTRLPKKKKRKKQRGKNLVRQIRRCSPFHSRTCQCRMRQQTTKSCGERLIVWQDKIYLLPTPKKVLWEYNLHSTTLSNLLRSFFLGGGGIFLLSR